MLGWFSGLCYTTVVYEIRQVLALHEKHTIKQRGISAAVPVKLLVSVLVITTLGTAPLSGSASARSLQEDLQDVLKTHPRLQGQKKAVGAAEDSIRQSRSAYFPGVVLSGDIGPEYVDSPSRRSTQGEDFFDTRRSTTLTITQNLFNGFGTDSDVEIAKLGKARAALTLRIVEESVLFDGIRSYLNVLKQSRLLEIAKNNERTLQNQLELESARVERGSGLTVDVLQAKSRLQLARERVVSLFGDLRRAHSVYLEVFNRVAVPGRMTVPDLRLDALPETMEGALSIAADRSPVLKVVNRDVEIASEARTLAKATYWPRVDLVGEGSWENDVDGVPGIRREGQVVLRARWSLFDGFLTPASSARASKVYSAELDRRRNIDRDIRNKVRQAWSVYRTSREQRDLLENAVNIATEVFEARQKLRRAGRESVINVLDAENELNTARLRFTDATFNHILASYRVLFQTGHLTPETLGLTR